MKFTLSNEWYNILKWVALICLPAISVFVSTVGRLWGLEAELLNAIVGTINAIGVLIGALIGVSQLNIDK